MFTNLLPHLVSPDASVIGDRSQALDDIQEEVAELLREVIVGGGGNSVDPIGRHLSTNTLEEYALGLLVDAGRDSVEDHLLVCHVCTGKLERADSVIAFFKTVLTPDSSRDKHRSLSLV